MGDLPTILKYVTNMGLIRRWWIFIS